MTKLEFENKFKGTILQFKGNDIIIEMDTHTETFTNISFDRVIKYFEKNYNNELKTLIEPSKIIL